MKNKKTINKPSPKYPPNYSDNSGSTIRINQITDSLKILDSETISSDYGCFIYFESWIILFSPRKSGHNFNFNC